jgi:hypothetical protein
LIIRIKYGNRNETFRIKTTKISHFNSNSQNDISYFRPLILNISNKEFELLVNCPFIFSCIKGSTSCHWEGRLRAKGGSLKGGLAIGKAIDALFPCTRRDSSMELARGQRVVSLTSRIPARHIYISVPIEIQSPCSISISSNLLCHEALTRRRSIVKPRPLTRDRRLE